MKQDTLIIAGAIIIGFALFSSSLVSIGGTTVTNPTVIKQLEQPNIAPKYDCSLSMDKDSYDVGDEIIGILKASPETACDIYAQFDTWQVYMSDFTDSNGRLERSTVAEQEGTYHLRAVCSDGCVTNIAKFIID